MHVLQGIAKQYPNLFGVTSEPTDNESEANSGQTFRERYGWIAVVNNMANNDRSKWQYFFELNLIEFLNAVVFYKDKAQEDLRIWQAQQK